MKVILKDRTEIEVNSARVYMTPLEGYEPNITLIISGDKLAQVGNEAVFKAKFSDENISEVKIVRDKDGEDIVIGSYNCSALYEFFHHYTDYEDRIDIVLTLAF